MAPEMTTARKGAIVSASWEGHPLFMDIMDPGVDSREDMPASARCDVGIEFDDLSGKMTAYVHTRAKSSTKIRIVGSDFERHLVRAIVDWLEVERQDRINEEEDAAARGQACGVGREK